MHYSADAATVVCNRRRHLGVCVRMKMRAIRLLVHTTQQGTVLLPAASTRTAESHRKVYDQFCRACILAGGGVSGVDAKDAKNDEKKRNTLSSDSRQLRLTPDAGGKRAHTRIGFLECFFRTTLENERKTV